MRVVNNFVFFAILGTVLGVGFGRFLAEVHITPRAALYKGVSK